MFDKLVPCYFPFFPLILPYPLLITVYPVSAISKPCRGAQRLLTEDKIDNCPHCGPGAVIMDSAEGLEG